MKSVLILLAVFFIVRAIKKRLEPPGAIPGAKNTKTVKTEYVKREGEEMVMDPICGSYVPVSSAASFNDGGKTLYFCGPECLERFKSGS